MVANWKFDEGQTNIKYNLSVYQKGSGKVAVQ
jgi:hypothetical protein